MHLYARPLVYLVEEADYDELYDFLTMCLESIMRWKYLHDKRKLLIKDMIKSTSTK